MERGDCFLKSGFGLEKGPVFDHQFGEFAGGQVALDNRLDKGFPEARADGAKAHNVPRCSLAERVPDCAAEASPYPCRISITDCGQESCCR